MGAGDTRWSCIANCSMSSFAEPATSQVRDIVNRHADSIEYVEVDDPGIFDDIDDPRLYQSLLEREGGLQP